MSDGLSLALTHELADILEARDWDQGEDCHEACCPNCGDVLDLDYDNEGFPCEDCTKCQPMDGWHGSWPKISEDDPRYKDIPLAPECCEVTA